MASGLVVRCRRSGYHQAVAAFPYSTHAGRNRPMPAAIKVGVITHAQGAHLDAYLPALAQIAEASEVVLADPSGQKVALAQKALGSKLKETFTDVGAMLRKHQPGMALVK